MCALSPAPGACVPALLRPPFPAASRPVSLTSELLGGVCGGVWSQVESPGDSAGHPCHLPIFPLARQEVCVPPAGFCASVPWTASVPCVETVPGLWGPSDP